jgi:hypothetical protein
MNVSLKKPGVEIPGGVASRPSAVDGVEVPGGRRRRSGDARLETGYNPCGGENYSGEAAPESPVHVLMARVPS